MLAFRLNQDKRTEGNAMRDTYPSAIIAAALGITPQAWNKRALKENIPFAELRGQGGSRQFITVSLPVDVRDKLAIYEAKQALAATEAQAPAIAQNAPSPSIPVGKKLDKALARMSLVDLYTEQVSKAKSKKKAAAREAFMAAYEAGVWKHLLEVLGPTSWKSIERWKVQMRAAADPLTVMVDGRGGQMKGKRMLTEETQQIVLAKALHPHRHPISEVARHAQRVLRTLGRDEETIPSERTVRRYCEDWKALHYDEWVFMRRGKKAWNDLCCFIIERNYDLIDVGDIAVADGHTLNFEIINPWTGKQKRMTMVVWFDMKSNYPMGWDIMPSEDTQCISVALRRSILCLGKKPKVAYMDNGKSFRGKHFAAVDLKQSGLGGLFQSLGIEPLYAWPYHGQSKPVERFFGTFAELERWAPSYSGTSIDTKPPRMHRDEKLHKQIYNAAGGRPLTLEEAHQAVAYWFDEYVRRPQRGHLKGKTPLEVFQAGRGNGMDVKELTRLMMAKEIKTIRNSVVSFKGNSYYHPHLAKRKHKVLIRYDLQDLDSIIVCTTDGKEICTAVKTKKHHPAARIMGTKQDEADLKDAIAIKKRQEKQATASAREMLETVVIPEHERQMAKVQTEKPALQVVEKEPAPLSQSKIKSIEAVKEQARARMAAAPTYTRPAEVREIRTEMDRYEYLFRLREKEGITLRDEDAAWMAKYEQGGEYQMNKRRYEQLTSVYQRQRAMAASG